LGVDLRHGPDISRDEIATALSRFHISLRSETALPVVFVGDYLDQSLESVNREMLDASMPWLLVKLGGRTPLLGPLLCAQQNRLLGVSCASASQRSSHGGVFTPKMPKASESWRRNLLCYFPRHD
jgi:hypothetical protein